MRKVIIILIIFAIIVLCIFFYFLNKKDKNKLVLYGNVEIRQVDLSFQVNGRIENVYAEEGDYIKKGQLLAKLDDRDYRANYSKAYFKVKESSAKSKEDLSKYTRNHPLCMDEIVSKEECETLLNNKNSSNATNKLDKANLQYYKNQLSYTKLYAPQDGIISTRSQEKGARISEGQVVYVMNLTKPIWIRTYINEKDLGNIKYGMKARVLTDTIDSKTGKNKEYTGRVGYISPVAEFTPKTVQSEDLRVDLVYRIRIYIDKVDEYLRQGMPTTVVFDLKKDDK